MPCQQHRLSRQLREPQTQEVLQHWPWPWPPRQRKESKHMLRLLPQEPSENLVRHSENEPNWRWKARPTMESKGDVSRQGHLRTTKQKVTYHPVCVQPCHTQNGAADLVLTWGQQPCPARSSPTTHTTHRQSETESLTPSTAVTSAPCFQDHANCYLQVYLYECVHRCLNPITLHVQLHLESYLSISSSRRVTFSFRVFLPLSFFLFLSLFLLDAE